MGVAGFGGFESDKGRKQHAGNEERLASVGEGSVETAEGHSTVETL